jgi:hypothetical protein
MTGPLILPDSGRASRTPLTNWMAASMVASMTED